MTINILDSEGKLIEGVKHEPSEWEDAEEFIDEILGTSRWDNGEGEMIAIGEVQILISTDIAFEAEELDIAFPGIPHDEFKLNDEEMSWEKKIPHPNIQR